MLEFYQAPYRSLPCVVYAANLPAPQVAQLLNVVENEGSMHALRDEPDCQVCKSCAMGNATALKMNELVWDTYMHHVHVNHSLRWEVLNIKPP